MKRKIITVVTGLVGIILMMSFTIQQEHFHSGIYGVLGSILLVGAYVSAHYEAWREHDRRVRHVTITLAVLCVLLVALNLVEQVI